MIEVKKEECCGCRNCESSCKVNAIQMKVDLKGFYYPYVDKEKCIGCDVCRKVCPLINFNNNSQSNYVVAFKRKDLKKRMKSQSGGGICQHSRVFTCA